MPSTSLTKLPYAVLVDNIVPFLLTTDLVALRATSRDARALVDDEVIWMRKVAEEFNFPLHSSARVGGWQRLYKGLFRPETYVWGEVNNCRLGGADAAVPLQEREHINRTGAAPFPLLLNVGSPANVGRTLADDGEGIGRVVDLGAGGWSFHALTSKGNILYWGQMDGDAFIEEDSLSHPSKLVGKPALLALPAHIKVTSLSCGRKHALALTSDGQILEWRAWGSVRLIEDDAGFDAARRAEAQAPANFGGQSRLAGGIAQTEAGWDFSSVLVHRPDTDGLQSEVYVWYKEWSTNIDQQSEGPQLPRTSTTSLRLPSLPEAPTNVFDGAATAQDQDASTPVDPHRFIIRIAAGENFVVALTASGLVYKLNIPQLYTLASTQQRQVFSGKQAQWTLLEQFCLPSRIGEQPDFQSSAGRVTPDTRITHVTAHFRHFVAYSVPPTSGPSTSTSTTTNGSGGIVLLGTNDSVQSSAPQVIPDLQGRGVIKVLMGDYHLGALTDEGELLTWGQWSKGALGIWHALPSSDGNEGGSGPALEQPSTEGSNLIGLPHIRFGHAARGMNRGAGIIPRAGSRAAQAQARRLGHDPDSGRQIPTKVEYPMKVVFPDEVQNQYRREGKRKYVFAAAFAGWHSGALAFDLGPASTTTTWSTSSSVEQGTNPDELERNTRPGDMPDLRAVSGPSGLGLGLRIRQHRPADLDERDRGNLSRSLLSPSVDGPTISSSTPTASSPPNLSDRPSSTSPRELELSRFERRGTFLFVFSATALVLGIWGLLGGWESLVPPSANSPTSNSNDGDRPRYLQPPFNLAYLLPLLVPVSTYLVITRWVGEKYFRHS